jgi:uncharacterized ion transporter superfamily protein YfcC
MEEKKGDNSTALRIGKKAFFSTVAIILVLMITAGILTRVVRAGNFRHEAVDGRDTVVAGSFAYGERPDYPVWRWFLAPLEVLVAPGNVTVITLVVLMLLIGGSFTVLEKGGILKSALSMIVARFEKRRFVLMAAVIFFFMFSASVLGIYEELAPMVVFIVPLALLLGWDSLTGLGMSLLALGFGFSAAILNPFTIGVAQTAAGLPLFSGAWFRVIFFVLTYALVFLFVRAHALKVERSPESSPVFADDERLRSRLDASSVVGSDPRAADPRMRAGVRWLALWFLGAVVFVLVATRFKTLSAYSFPIMGLFFLIACVGAGLRAGEGGRKVGRFFFLGVRSILPAIVIILMAMSVKQIILDGGIMDTILYAASLKIVGTSPYLAALLVYVLTLALEFFVASASAKAFLVIPILAPLADLVGLTRQSVILAYDYADGFTNILYPTNPMLMICLGLTVVSYPKWLRWTAPAQAGAFALSLAFMAIAVAIKFGPF